MPNSITEIPPQSRKIVGFTTAAFPSNGERQPVLGLFPRHVDAADAIAALIEAEAVDQGIEFKELLNQIAGKAPPVLPARLEKVPRGGSPGAPAHDWKKEYGKSAHYLGLSAAVYRAWHDSTLADALRAALIEAREAIGRGKRPTATIREDAAKLKQAVRGNTAKASGWRKDPSIDVWGTIGEI